MIIPDKVFVFIFFYYVVGFLWTWFANCVYNIRHSDKKYKLLSVLSFLINSTFFFAGIISNLFVYFVKTEEIICIDLESARRIIRISIVFDPLFIEGKKFEKKE